MIAPDEFAALASRFPALARLDAKLAERARDELRPDEVVERVDPVTVWGRPGIVWLSADRVFVVGSMKKLFMTLPAQSELRIDQLRTLTEMGDTTTLGLKSTATLGDDSDYEEVELTFAAPDVRATVVQALRVRRPDLASAAGPAKTT